MRRTIDPEHEQEIDHEPVSLVHVMVLSLPSGARAGEVRGDDFPGASHVLVSDAGGQSGALECGR